MSSERESGLALMNINYHRDINIEEAINTFAQRQPRRLRADLHDTILSHATSSRQAYDMTYDCRSVLKHVLKCCDIFSEVHNNRKSCRGPVVSRCRMRQSRTV